MIKTLRHSYFPDRNYLFMYGHNFFKTSALLTMFLFTGGWLYKSGLDLHWIVLYHAANFTLMGIFSPLSAVFCRRYGLFVTLAVSFAGFFLTLVALSMAAHSPVFVIIAVTVSGIANGVHNPVDIMFQAIYVDDRNRGRAFSLANVLVALGTMLSILFSGWLLEKFALPGMAGLTAFLFAMALVCVFFMDERIKGKYKTSARELYASVFRKEFRDCFWMSLGLQFIVISGVVFTPIVLYLATENFQDMAVIAGFAVLFQTVLLLAQGLWVDKTSCMRPLRFACFMNALGMVIYSFLAHTKLMLFVADTIQRTGLLMSFGALLPRLHSDIRKKQGALIPFGASFHMAVCFWEAVTLPALALLVFLGGAGALPYCMLICAAGGFITYFAARKFNMPD